MGEHGRKPSPFKKKSLKIRDFLSRNLDLLQLLEKMITKFEDTVLEEPNEPADTDTKTTIF